MQVPRPVMDKDLKAEEKELTDDINSLMKKVRRKLYYYRLLVAHGLRICVAE